MTTNLAKHRYWICCERFQKMRVESTNTPPHHTASSLTVDTAMKPQIASRNWNNSRERLIVCGINRKQKRGRYSSTTGGTHMETYATQGNTISAQTAAARLLQHNRRKGMNRVQWKFVEDALDQDEKLSAWECDFISDLADRGEDYELSEKQNAVLNRISQKIL